MFRNKFFIQFVPCDQGFQHAVDKGDVAAAAHLKKIVHDFRAEKRAAHNRRRPRALQAVFARGADDRDARALFLGVVQVFRRHGLVVSEVGAEDHQEISADEIRQRAGRGAYAERCL